MQNYLSRLRRQPDILIAAGLATFSFAIYLRTLAPSVAELFDDSLEFQLVAPRMAIAHPTGYPLYSILIKLFTFLPFGDVAYRVNLASALFGAVAVAMLYAVSRQLIESRGAAVIAALVFAFGETFWSQAVLAEVYTLQAFLTLAMIWLTLKGAAISRDRQGVAKPPAAGTEQSPASSSGQPMPTRGFTSRLKTLAQVSPVTLAFFFGLMLTHHRLSLLLLPALAVYVFSRDRRFLRVELGQLIRMAIAFALPLLLYLYIPIRGLFTSSLDGTYQNTLPGFFNWVLGSSYNVFLTQNPLNQQRQLGYYVDLFLRQSTWVGIAIITIGFFALARHRWRESLLLTLALGVNLAFAITYRVADINVFFIPSFVFASLFFASGADWIAHLPANVLNNQRLHLPFSALFLLLLLIIPLYLLQSNLKTVDMTGKWDVHDYGRDVLSQPLPANSTVVGILGEMTLLRYFQETQGLRSDVQTIAADKEPARVSEIANDLQNGRVVFLTRQLPGADKEYSLASFGPLVLVQSKPNTTTPPSPSHPLDENFGGVTLLGYDLDPSRLGDTVDWHLYSGRQIRVTLYWRVDNAIPYNRYVSLKLLRADGTRGAQLDRRPVLDSYPTTSWRVGEFISDTYDLPILTGAAPGEYSLQVTLYDPKSGQVHGQKDLTTITLPPDTHDHLVVTSDVDHQRVRDFGGINLVGYSLDTSGTYKAGTAIPVTLLWRATTAGVQHKLELKLVDDGENAISSFPFALGDVNVQPAQYLRQEIAIPIPKEQPKGPLSLEVDNAAPDYLACELPLFTPCTVLGRVQTRK